MAQWNDERTDISALVFTHANRILEILGRSPCDEEALGTAINGLKGCLNHRIKAKVKDFPEKWGRLVALFRQNEPPGTDPLSWTIEIRLMQFELLMDCASESGVLDVRPVARNSFSLGRLEE